MIGSLVNGVNIQSPNKEDGGYWFLSRLKFK